MNSTRARVLGLLAAALIAECGSSLPQAEQDATPPGDAWVDAASADGQTGLSPIADSAPSSGWELIFDVPVDPGRQVHWKNIYVAASATSPDGSLHLAIQDPKPADLAFRIDKWSHPAFQTVGTGYLPSLPDSPTDACSRPLGHDLESMDVLGNGEIWVGLDSCGCARWTNANGWVRYPKDNNYYYKKGYAKNFYLINRMRGHPSGLVAQFRTGLFLWEGGEFKETPACAINWWEQEFVGDVHFGSADAIWVASTHMNNSGKRDDDSDHYYFMQPADAMKNTCLTKMTRTATGWQRQQVAPMPGYAYPQAVARLTQMFACLGGKLCIVGGHGLMVYEGFEFKWQLQGPIDWPPLRHWSLGGGLPVVFAADDIWWGPAHYDGAKWTIEKLPKEYPESKESSKDPTVKTYHGHAHLGTYWADGQLLVVMRDGVYRRLVPPKPKGGK